MSATVPSATILFQPPIQAIEKRRRNMEMHELVMGAGTGREVPAGLLPRSFRLENQVTAAAEDLYFGEWAWSEWLDDLLAVFACGTRCEVDEIIEAREEFVVAAFSARGRGAQSGDWIDFGWIGVTWFRNSRAVRSVSYPSREHALQTARRTLLRKSLRIRPTSPAMPR